MDALSMRNVIFPVLFLLLSSRFCDASYILTYTGYWEPTFDFVTPGGSLSFTITYDLDDTWAPAPSGVTSITNDDIDLGSSNLTSGSYVAQGLFATLLVAEVAPGGSLNSAFSPADTWITDTWGAVTVYTDTARHVSESPGHRFFNLQYETRMQRTYEDWNTGGITERWTLSESAPTVPEPASIITWLALTSVGLVVGYKRWKHQHHS